MQLETHGVGTVSRQTSRDEAVAHLHVIRGAVRFT